MALNVETGQGLAEADSFTSVADADAYLLGLGYTVWTSETTEPEREAALRRATEFMEQSFRGRWVGERAGPTQGLSWPRLNAVADGYPVPAGTVPRDVARACALLAFRAASGELLADATGLNVKREKVDVLEVEYDTTKSSATFYRSIELALAPFLKGSASPNFSTLSVVRT